MNQPRVLLVEDNDIDIMSVKRIFKRNSFDCQLDVVFDGEEALIYLAAKDSEELPQVILLDLNMPRMNGFEFLEARSLEERLRGIPVFVLSTSNVNIDVDKARELGAAGLISKPLDFPVFLKLAGLPFSP